MMAGAAIAQFTTLVSHFHVDMKICGSSRSVHNPLAITVSVDVQFAVREQPQLFGVEFLQPLKLTWLAALAALNTLAG